MAPVSSNRSTGRRPVTATVRDRAQPALLALVPWVAFYVAVFIAGRFVDFHDPTPRWVLDSIVFFFVVVYLPALAAIGAVSRGAIRRIMVALMVGLTVFAGSAATLTDDAQAGLAVLWVPMIALPVAVIGALIEHLWRRDRVDTSGTGD